MTEISDTTTQGASALAHTATFVVRRVISAAVACVWLYHGLYNKLLGGEPRHLAIVQSVPGLGGAAGEAALVVIGAGEVLLGLWVMHGRWPRGCAAVVEQPTRDVSGLLGGAAPEARERDL